MTEQAPVRGACPVCACKKIVRCDMSSADVSEVHQCTSCGAQLVAALGMKRVLLLGALGVLASFLVVLALVSVGDMPGFSPVWRLLCFFVAIGAIYGICQWQIRRGIQYELWTPINSY